MNSPDASAFKTLFERTSDAAVVVGDEGGGRVLAANDAFARLSGRAPASLAGESIESLVEFDESAGNDAARILTGGGEGARVKFERAACAWDGRAATLYLFKGARGAALDEGRTEALLSYLQEATEQVEVVNRVVAAVNSSRTIDEVFSLASEQMRSLVPFDRASIALCEPD
ncbi:MAG TPA: PAS domain-containing protein, partial [Pyrinomonadaceae bacterium]|nr:PAS domain-containing protein [Pyrinomonadaceae bacterium]